MYRDENARISDPASLSMERVDGPISESDAAEERDTNAELWLRVSSIT